MRTQPTFQTQRPSNKSAAPHLGMATPNLLFKHAAWMLSEDGDYPIRRNDYTDKDYEKRAKIQPSPWLADWESAGNRSGWVTIREFGGGTAEWLPFGQISPASPEDADLFSLKHNKYLILLPSHMFNGKASHLFEWIINGYPSGLVIVHALPESKGAITVHEHGADGLLSPECRVDCASLKGFVEFNGRLYESNTETSGPEWIVTKDVLALTIYHEYRWHSAYYHEEQEAADLALALHNTSRNRLT